MPSVDELLLNGIDTLDGAEALEETNKYCEIDETGRVIILNDLAEILGVENDKAVERVYFRCPRYVGDNVDLDLKQCTVYINFQNANMDKDQYIVTDLDTDGIDDTKVTFSWLLSKKVTQYKGIVNFIVCARKTKTGGEIEQEWNTTLAKATVLEGLEPDPYVVPSDDLDVVNQLVDLVKQEIEQKGQETIASIPEDYTSLSKELVDIRAGADGKTYPSAGEAVRGQIRNTLYSMPNVYITDVLDDFNNAEFNKIYMISTTGVLNHPHNNDPGILVTYSAAGVSENYGVQVFYTMYGNPRCYLRYVNGGIWTNWIRVITTNDEVSNVLKINLYNVTSSEILDDLNNAKANTVYMISTNEVLNKPTDASGVVITYSNYIPTYDPPNYGAQVFYTTAGGGPTCYLRHVYNGSWSNWIRLLSKNDISNDFLNISLFETIGIVGDSYASGAIYKDDSNFVIKYNKSWPQILARDSGVTVTNFSAAGLSTRSWLTSNKGLQLVQSEEPKELYGLFLGINDYHSLGESYLGSITDITSHDSYTEYPDTFYGNYGKIIEQISIKAPDAFMIISTVANTAELPMKFNTAIEEIAEHYNIPVIKQHEDSYFLSSFYKNQMIGGHPIAINYSGMAIAIKRMIEECLKDNISYFNKAFSE